MPTEHEALQTKNKLKVDFNEISLTGSTIYHGSGIPDYNPDTLVGKKGLDIYSKMREDDQVKAVLTMKKFARLMTSWEIQPASQDLMDVEIADFVKTNFDNLSGTFEDCLLNIYTALDFGFSVSEKLWYQIDKGKYSGKIGLKGLKTREPFYYNFESDVYGNLKDDGIIYVGPTPIDLQYKHVTSQNIISNSRTFGYRLPKDKFVIYSYNKEFSNWYGRSDLRSAYRSWWSKEILIRFMNMYMERFGMPTHVAKYPKGLSKSDKESLKTVLDRVQSKYSIVIPEDIAIELLQAGGGGEGAFRSSIEMHNKFISRSILVPDLMGFNEFSGGGSYALGKKHFDVFLWILQKLGKDTEETIVGEQIIKQLVDYNYSNVENYPKFKFESITAEGTATRANIIQMGVAGGFINPQEEWIREYLALPKSDKKFSLGIQQPEQQVIGNPLGTKEGLKDNEDKLIDDLKDETGMTEEDIEEQAEKFTLHPKYYRAIELWKKKKFSSKISISKIKTYPKQLEWADGNKIQGMVDVLRRGEELEPIEVDREFNLKNGRHRLLAYKFLGKESVPVKVCDYVEDGTKWITVNGRHVPIKDGKPDFGGKLKITKGISAKKAVEKNINKEDWVRSHFKVERAGNGKYLITYNNGDVIDNLEVSSIHVAKKVLSNYPISLLDVNNILGEEYDIERRKGIKEFYKNNELLSDKRFDYKINYTQMEEDLDEYEQETVEALSKIINEQKDALLKTVERKQFIENKDYNGINSLQLKFVGDFKKELENRLIKLYLDSKLESLKEIAESAEGEIEIVTKFANEVTIQPWIPVSPTEAIDFFNRKVNAKIKKKDGEKVLVTLATGKELKYYSAKAFAIAGIQKDEILKKAKLVLLNGLKQGSSVKEVMYGLGNIFDEYLLSGEIKDEELVTPYRLETIVRTNFSEAMNAGRRKMMDDPDLEDFIPYVRYSAILDSRVRDTHAQMHGRIFTRTNPIIDLIQPPNGYQCRCVLTPITAYDVKRLNEKGDGIEVSDDKPLPEGFPDVGFGKYTKELNYKIYKELEEIQRCPYPACSSSSLDIGKEDDEGTKIIHCKTCKNKFKLTSEGDVYLHDKGNDKWIKQDYKIVSSNITAEKKYSEAVYRCPYSNCGSQNCRIVNKDKFDTEQYECLDCKNEFKVTKEGELYLYDKVKDEWILQSNKISPKYIEGEK